MTALPPVRLRADARRNRDKIVAAAVHAFTEDGPYLPMEEIARLAGVGVGTLYRHFPDRDALIIAVVQGSLATMLARARAAMVDEPCAWDALIRSMSGSPELRLALRLPNLFQPATTEVIRADPEIRRIRGELMAQIDTLVQAAQQEGTLRADVGTGDVVHLFSLLLQGMQKMPRELGEVVYERSCAIVLDGLRTRRGPLLPGGPLTLRDITE
ncbi:TetR/AcrR family transcriptional regulator [Parafrankia sp. FMc2]|uniref:TetR/AcrR family transcriptional regulator n=1 Tax=Parafrankia sp. FMc2 TaxID=3233196 RepID=UPI0034D59D64